MKNLCSYLIILMALVLGLNSCVPGQEAAKGRKTSKNSGATSSEDTTDDNSPADPVFDSGSDVFWFSGTTDFENFITLNEDSSTVIYLRGDSVHSFLGASIDGTKLNINRSYCLVASFNDSRAKKNIRMRAIPITIFNFQSNSQERLLRVDVPDTSSNTSTCSGSALQILTTADAGTTASSNLNEVAFNLSSLCPTCFNILASTDVSLYLANETGGLTTNDRIPESIINLGNLVLRVDTSSNSQDQGGGTCTQDECSAKGFDCCLQGQCVQDGSEKPNASSDPLYTQAKADVRSNPLNFIKYPSIYFVCEERPPVTLPTPTPLPDANATASARLQELINDFNCLEEGKKTSPDFAGNNVCAPNFDQASFEAVRSKVWAYCGCAADPFPTDPDDPRCPDFGLTATRNELSGNITAIECFTPPPVSLPTPFQNLSLSVNSRSAPHRFFKADDGAPVDNLTTLTGSEQQEGDSFQYADNSRKLGPNCGDNNESCSFNFNSITGSFNVDLSQARPAVVVDLEFDQSYIISTLSGFYTPCPQCDQDYWFQTFSAYPSSQNGNGLQALGYQTNRQEFGNNNPKGNYEDTHFGRACFLPPTMIPLSHQKKSTTVAQRSARLSAQAARWVNGYQRDWFGFNQGALIGSFNGVNWFAIGRNRRVIATSGKLFLAINAPYADLADASDFVVSVVLDNVNSISPTHDFDPNLEPNSVEQNSGASCQYFHQCETDTDCVTALGWEYMCADTNVLRTNLPKFDINALEIESDERNNSSFSRVIHAGYPDGSRKRCVYRGAGALCKKDFTSNLAANQKKHFTCAPNFHCADLDERRFNSAVVREPSNELSIKFGYEANILGRPLSYAQGLNALPDAAIENIKYNASLYTSDTDDIGLCVPSRYTTSTDRMFQHRNSDQLKRTDYISQVGACNASQLGLARTVACPIIETRKSTDANPIPTEVGDIILPDVVEADYALLSATQNSCGQESFFRNPTTGDNVSSFASIEADPLTTLRNLVTPMLPRDACLRRAGSVCHTDLDCAPNRMHRQVALTLSVDEFGSTEAEQKYWQENLICGQATEKPLINSEGYFDYDMGENRCCREIGNDFTMYTQKNLTISTNNDLLQVASLPRNNPTQDGRYSRYSVVNIVEGDASKTALTPPIAEAPIVDIANQRVPAAYQWKTLNDTGNLTCCGGGWIRKFADGSTNWAKTDRLSIDFEKFKCLNYYTEDVEQNALELGINPENADLDKNEYCRAPFEDGCSQIEFPAPTTDGRLIVPSRKGSFSATLNTKPIGAGIVGMDNMSADVPFEPFPFANNTPLNENEASDRFTYFASPEFYFGLSFYLPSYIQKNNISNVIIQYYNENEDGTYTAIGGQRRPMTDRSGSCVISTNPEAQGGINDLTPEDYCIVEDSTGTVFHAQANNDFDGDITTQDWAIAAVEIVFFPQNSASYTYPGGSTKDNFLDEGMIRGNEMYYLSKLGRFELIGIPQIVYEPLYCNTNRDKLVPGFFNNVETREEFDAIAATMEGANLSENGRPLIAMYDEGYSAKSSTETAVYRKSGIAADIENVASFYDQNPGSGVFADKNEKFVFATDANQTPIVSHPQIFSEDEFRCCVKLGNPASADNKCCSGNRDDEGLCKLPNGADLHVYFNKFVSGEGIGESLPEGGLLDTDFIPESGEPKISDSVLSKVVALGEAFCESGTVRGGTAFGFYFPQPNNGTINNPNGVDLEEGLMWSIIDSTRENPLGGVTGDPATTVGVSPFLNGFRWNHHVYCVEGGE